MSKIKGREMQTQGQHLSAAVPAKAVGHLGHRLRPPFIRGLPNSNNILYNIAFSSGKKNIGLQTAITKSHQAMKACFSQRPVSHREKS